MQGPSEEPTLPGPVIRLLDRDDVPLQSQVHAAALPLGNRKGRAALHSRIRRPVIPSMTPGWIKAALILDKMMRQDRSGRTLGEAHAADRLKLRASTTLTPARWRGCCTCPLKHGKQQDCDAIRCTPSTAGLFWRHRRRPPCARAAPNGSFQCGQGIERREDLQVSSLPPLASPMSLEGHSIQSCTGGLI